MSAEFLRSLPPLARTPHRLVAAMCLAEVLNMAGIFAFPALLPDFIHLWNLSNTQAGWISGVYFAGYTVSVPLLAGYTDRVDPRRIYLASTCVGILSCLGFALLAEGFWTALIFRAMGGFGLAGTFIPGLKGLVDRLEEQNQPRAISFYTATFSLGISLSFLATGFFASYLSWRWAFGFAALGGVLALMLAGLALRTGSASARSPGQSREHLLDFRPVLKNRTAMGYILAYTAHTWELFAARSWIVAFLSFSLTRQAQGADYWSPSTVVSLMALVAMWASVGGAELALKFGRNRVLTWIMWCSALYALLLGFSPTLPYPLLIMLCLGYFVFVQGDSAALHTGVVLSATPGKLGLTMAFQSLLGFAGAFVGPLLVGVVLDLSGGGKSVLSWVFAFTSMGMVVGLGPLFIRLFCSGSNRISKGSKLGNE